VIREHNQLDLQLYDYAKQLIVVNLQAFPSKLKKDIENYKLRVSNHGREEGE
jgi:hypothetical protein